MTATPFRAVAMAPPRVEAERRADGSVVLRSPEPLGPHERQIGELLRRWAAERPEATFLAQRDPEAGGAWRRLSYGEARAKADAISQALLARGLGPDRPVLALSGNGIDHALLAFAAMQVGIPFAPVSPAYSLMSGDFSKVALIAGLVKPGLIFAEDGARFARVLAEVEFGGAELVVSRDAPAGRAATAFSELAAGTPGPAVEAAFARVGPDTVAKYLFTSGSTGVPKGVVNTQRMLCANQEMTCRRYPVLFEAPPVLVDWMPWNHTFGGNYCTHLTLKTGGTMYIDEGRPTPEGIAATLANLREIAPTVYFNVPAGYALLRAAMAEDLALRERFFSRLAYMKYAGAALPGDLWDGLQALSVAATGRRTVIVSGYGSTESAPSFTATHWPCEENGNVGIPLPAAECKLVPLGGADDGRYEIRGRGPAITPGYLDRPDLTAAAFDEEGFFRFGDAVRFVDPDDPARGLLFAGRLTEEFKLDTGTWVNAGALRPEIVGAAAPALRDVVICGQDRPYAAILAWPDAAGCRALAGLGPGAEIEALVAHPAVRAHLSAALAAHNRKAGGSSRRIGRALLMCEPPQADGNEITDKGYVNQRATLERRAALVERLYAEPPDDEAIVVSGAAS